jgi:hypothetical protein
MTQRALTMEEMNAIIDAIPETEKVIDQIHMSMDFDRYSIYYVEFIGYKIYATFYFDESDVPMFNRIIAWLEENTQ